MDNASQKLLGSVTIVEDIVGDIKKNVHNIADFGKKIEKYASEDITSLLDVILFGAINIDASDIHIEPQKNEARLRIRIDGILQDVALLERSKYQGILSRIKLLSKIKLNIVDKPQDGRFTIAANKTLIEIRSSSLPAEYGESIVMRILNPKNFMDLDNLGLRKDLYQILIKELQRPHGMIIVTGPTGSGKTTTLYAFLSKIQSTAMKIITIEDPIEYHLKGIQQTQVAPEKGYDFSEGLRSIVRQDPDVILVGEIRDLETAKIALQAALTGHLVLSTLHTNDAAGSIPRLVDLGENPTSIAPAINMVIGQRLVRKVCKECTTFKKPSPQELSQLKDGLKGVLGEIDGVPKTLDAIKIAAVKEGGCKACNFTGYKGRKGLYEIFLIDTQMEKFILTNPSVSSIKELLVKKGMRTIYQSGLIEVALGETTLEEVLRVAERD